MELKKEVLLIKLGGSVITDKSKPYSVNIPIIHDLTKQLAQMKVPYILAHGSGSFGHTSAKKYGGTHGYTSKLGIAKVALDATEINAIVMKILLEQGVPAISFRPMAMMLSRSGKLSGHFFGSLKEALSQGLVPVVYGDVIWDKQWKSTIFSGEKIVNHLAVFLTKKDFLINKIIEIGNTDGVYDNQFHTIPTITKKTWKKVRTEIVPIDADVTGGMLHKVEEALDIAQKGIETILISGVRKNSLLQVLKGDRSFATRIY